MRRLGHATAVLVVMLGCGRAPLEGTYAGTGSIKVDCPGQAPALSPLDVSWTLHELADGSVEANLGAPCGVLTFTPGDERSLALKPLECLQEAGKSLALSSGFLSLEDSPHVWLYGTQRPSACGMTLDVTLARVR